MRNTILFLFYLGVTIFYQGIADAETNKLNIFGWSEYVAPQSLKEFEKKTGIDVHYDTYDSDEVMDAKMLSGNTGYDIVFPSDSPILKQHLHLNLYLPLDRSKIPNYKNLDPTILQLLSRNDPGNKYSVPWMWSGTGIAYDVDKIKEIDPSAPLNSLEILFNPKYAKKFSKCGISWYNSAPMMLGLALLYHGKDPNDLTAKNLKLAKHTLQAVRQYTKKISEIAYADIENNKLCLIVGWAGEMDQNIRSTRFSSKSSSKKFKIFIPKEGFFVSIEAMTIPRTSMNVANAYKFINFVLNPHVTAYNTNFTHHMNSNKASYPFIKKEILQNKAINIPSNLLKQKAYSLTPQSKEIVRIRNRIWMSILTGD
jgi:putrescine transport system substrate-binding protein